MKKILSAAVFMAISSSAFAGTVVGGGDQLDCQPQAKVILAVIEQVNKLTIKPVTSGSFEDPYVLFKAVYDLQLSVPVYTIVFTKDCQFIAVRYSNNEG